MSALYRCSPTVAHRLQVDSGELYFLLLHFLAEGPCREAAASLQQEALTHQLLPARTDFQGAHRIPALLGGNQTLDIATYLHSCIRLALLARGFHVTGTCQQEIHMKGTCCCWQGQTLSVCAAAEQLIYGNVILDTVL